ncbi:hypothetical protein CONPUDRAFT_71288 [Coniophora puteana RWD-64-598 SS2]|uniref:Uncharacterized protein n=1 Tax=Coniophora puteana (strain RWD-64-598) TaxID=741705 RepID=A0A5M3MZI2_CONPW|nr:uncharacterized protein CONPUDRAFT_71288 [Coniophora puteana RWD-64-598 SS2]EIW84548.1 hypothetical protein CONPUDRAFT_71288 [Coniophora puteana RWD-64-598 SS2]
MSEMPQLLTRFHIAIVPIGIRAHHLDAVYHGQWIFDTPTPPHMDEENGQASNTSLVQVWRWNREKPNTDLVGYIPLPRLYCQHWFQLCYTISLEGWILRKFDGWYTKMARNDPRRDRGYSAMLNVSLDLAAHLEARIQIIKELLSADKEADHLPIFDEYIIRQQYGVESIAWRWLRPETRSCMVARPLDPINAWHLDTSDDPWWTLAPPYDEGEVGIRYMWQWGHIDENSERGRAIIEATAGAWAWQVDDSSSEWGYKREGVWSTWSDVRGPLTWLEENWISHLPSLAETGMSLPEARLWRGMDVEHPRWQEDGELVARVRNDEADEESLARGVTDYRRCTLQYKANGEVGEFPKMPDHRDWPHAPTCQLPGYGPRSCDRCCLKYLSGQWKGAFPDPPSPIRDVDRGQFPEPHHSECEIKPRMKLAYEWVTQS